jgi:hypothetical protein
MRILLFASLLTGCLTATAVPTAFHPTASDTERSVGVSIGGAYAKDGDTKLLTIPYGEGTIHVPLTPGQLSVHVAPDVAYVGYRYDLTKMADGGVGFAIEPLVGGSYYNTTSTDSQGMESKTEALALMVGVAPIISLPTASGFFYFVPKVGYQYVKNLNPASSTTNDSSKLYVVGGSVGVDVGNGVSVELAVHRVDSADSQAQGTSAAWLVVPTIGYRH